MNAPVTAAPGIRPAAPRAADAGRSTSAAPFASALEGALGKNHAAELRDDRAAEHAADKGQRVVDRSRGAADRALEKADRTEARTDRAAEAASRRAAGEAAHEAPDADPARPVEDAPAPHPGPPPTVEVQEVGQAAEAPRGGLPALWALVMGGSPASPPPRTDPVDPGTTAPVGQPGAPAVETGVDVPVAAPSAGRSPADTATHATSATGRALPGAAVPVAEAARSAASPAGAGGRGLPAVLSAVLAETGAVVVMPGAPAGAAPPTAAVAALPLELVLNSGSAAGTPVAEAPPLALTPTPVVTASEVEPAANASTSGSTDAVVVPVGGSAGEAPSADAGGTGGSGGDDAPAATGSTGQAGLAPVASMAGPTTAAVTDVEGAAGAAATLPVASQVARHVAVLSGGPDGDHSMTLVLTPDTLGEVQVQVTLSKGSIELALRGAHEHGRGALLEALPDLRRDLEAAGLNPSRVEVARDTGGSLLDRQPTPQQGSGDRGGQHDRGDDRSRPGGRPADNGRSGPSLNPTRSTSSGVDVLA